jgi:hypothetical protein
MDAIVLNAIPYFHSLNPTSMKLLSLSWLLPLFVFQLTAIKVLAQSDQILAEEHFAENDRGWNLGFDMGVDRKIEDGKLVLDCKKYLAGGGGYWIKMPDLKLPADGYSISFTTHWIKNAKEDDSYSPYGMILGDYYFLIYGDGERRLLKYNTEEKKYEILVDWNQSSSILQRDEGDNLLEIQYKDGKAAFYANGQMLYKKEVAIPEGTVVKLYIENSEVVAYDDLVVKML